MTDHMSSERALSKCHICGNNTFTYRNFCNKCAWERMKYWEMKTEVFVGLIRSLSRNVHFVEYENEREQRIKQRAKDND
jgi:uncharacterized OB-fold protein